MRNVRWNLTSKKALKVLGSNVFLPVDVRTIAKSHDIQIIEDDLDEISGFIAKEDDVIIIGVNNKQSPVRQRFTIAHELGHYFLHGLGHTFVDKFTHFRNAVSSKASNPYEIEANTFAAELLMPKDLVRDKVLEILRNNPNLEDAEELIEHLAPIFEVSEQAMNFRLIKLGIINSESYN